MRNQYTTNTISGYNSSPPPDDGTQSAANRVTWSGIKSKLADPINTLSAAINTGVLSAFGKVPFFAKNSQAANYTAVAADDGKFIPFTASGNLTLPAATAVGEGYTIGVINAATAPVGLTFAAAANTLDSATATIFALNQRGDSAIFVAGTAADWWSLGRRIGMSFGAKVLTGTATTYSAATDLIAALILAQGGGGGGGSGDTTNNSNGGGGGGGACGIKLFTSATFFATFALNEPCRVASGGPGGSTSAGTAGGDSTFGATGLVSATGGAGGARDSGGSGSLGAAGGAAGVGGDLNLPGGPGAAAAGGAGFKAAGDGGKSFFGMGGLGGGGTAADGAGGAGVNYGSGGGGGHRDTGNVTGGAGAPGVIYVIELRR